VLTVPCAKLIQKETSLYTLSQAEQACRHCIITGFWVSKKDLGVVTRILAGKAGELNIPGESGDQKDGSADVHLSQLKGVPVVHD